MHKFKLGQRVKRKKHEDCVTWHATPCSPMFDNQIGEIVDCGTHDGEWYYRIHWFSRRRPTLSGFTTIYPESLEKESWLLSMNTFIVDDLDTPDAIEDWGS